MHDRLAIVDSLETRVARHNPMFTPGSNTNLAIRQLFRPYVLAFLALAIAVGGNGYGYKLAQYLRHSEVSKALATRMWVDHRDDSSIKNENPHQRPQQIAALDLFLVSAPQVPCLTRDHTLTTPAPARAAFVISSHIPFRAPPSRKSFMA